MEQQNGPEAAQAKPDDSVAAERDRLLEELYAISERILTEHCRNEIDGQTRQADVCEDVSDPLRDCLSVIPGSSEDWLLGALEDILEHLGRERLHDFKPGIARAYHATIGVLATQRRPARH